MIPWAGGCDGFRQHLAHIAEMFCSDIHDRVPAGVPVMNRLKNRITYTSEAVKAVHDFLRFQITDHKTGDPLTLDGRKAQ